MVQKFLPISEGSNPSVKLQAVNIADIFEGEKVLYFLLDYLENAWQQRALLLKNVSKLLMVLLYFLFFVFGERVALIVVLLLILGNESQQISHKPIDGFFENLVENPQMFDIELDGNFFDYIR